MFKIRPLLKHNYSNYNREIREYLRKVYLESLDYYEELYCNNNPTGTERLDLVTIDKGIGYLDDYLYYFYSNYPDKFEKVFNSIKRNVKKVTVLAPSDRGIYGQFVPFAGVVYINPQLRSSRNLTKDERTRLYFCHELGHAVHLDWMRTFANNFSVNNPDIKNIMVEGFNLIDEATTQDQAEDIAYYYAGKNRPEQTYYRGTLFDGEPYKSNFDFYGNLQESATMFGRTLRGIGKRNNDNTALKILSLRALDRNFINDIVYEYRKDGQIDNLYLLLPYLGLIKKASYATFGYDDKKYINKSSKALAELKKLANSLRDYREPLKRQF